MSNDREQNDIKSLGVSCREQTWEIRYAYAVLMKILCDKYGYEREYYTKEVSPYKACQYDRSANLCREHLLSKGLITQLNQPVMDVVLQTATQYAVAFEFDISCNTSSYRTEPYDCPNEAYEDLTRLENRKLFYVYLNKDKYDIHVYRKTESVSSSVYGGRRNRYRYSSSSAPTEREVTELKVFPKNKRKELIDNLCRVKVKRFIEDHIQLRAKIFYDLELRTMNNDSDEWKNVTQFNKDTPITVEEFDKRMHLAQEAVSFFQRTYGELQALRDRLVAGKTINVDQDIYKKTIEYFKINAPLYINEEEDKDLKHFAILTLKGADNKQIANEWMNPHFRWED